MIELLKKLNAPRKNSSMVFTVRVTTLGYFLIEEEIYGIEKNTVIFSNSEDKFIEKVNEYLSKKEK